MLWGVALHSTLLQFAQYDITLRQRRISNCARDGLDSILSLILLINVAEYCVIFAHHNAKAYIALECKTCSPRSCYTINPI